MKETGDDRDTSAEGFFKALDEKCSEYAPDLVKVDQITLKQELLYHDMDAENIDWIHFDESLKHLDIKDGIVPKVQSKRMLMRRHEKKPNSKNE